VLASLASAMLLAASALTHGFSPFGRTVFLGGLHHRQAGVTTKPRLLLIHICKKNNLFNLFFYTLVFLVCRPKRSGSLRNRGLLCHFLLQLLVVLLNVDVGIQKFEKHVPR